MSSLAFAKHLDITRSWFGKHGYPKKLVDNHLRRIAENRPKELPEYQTKHETGVPLLVTHHPQFHDLSRIIKKYFIYLYDEEQVKWAFTPAQFLLF